MEELIHQNWTRPRWRWYCAFRCGVIRTIFLVGLVAVGCSKNLSTDKLKPTDPGITVDAQDGSVSLSLSLSPSKPDTSEPARLTIEALADDSVTLTLDNYVLALRDTDTYYDYRLVPRHQETALPQKNGQLRWRMEYDLTFALAGDYEFPPARVSFETATITSSVDASIDENSTLQTESLRVTVVDTIDNEMTSEELATIETLRPVELPPQWSRWWWLGPLLFIAALVGLALLLYLAGLVFTPARRLFSWLRGRFTGDGQSLPEEIIPAHMWARRAIAALLAEELLSRGLVKPFYYRISDIMRGYIERRFEVHAPDMTTEEFLATVGHDARFPTTTTVQLESFLEACDLVKYARMQPGLTQADQLVQAAEHFVETTYEPEPSANHTPGVDMNHEQGAAA